MSRNLRQGAYPLDSIPASSFTAYFHARLLVCEGAVCYTQEQLDAQYNAAINMACELEGLCRKRSEPT